MNEQAKRAGESAAVIPLDTLLADLEDKRGLHAQGFAGLGQTPKEKEGAVYNEVSLNRLYGRREAEGPEVKQTEQPWMRKAAQLLASGAFTVKAVATMVDKTPKTVSDLMKNGWFQELVIKLQMEAGGGADLIQLFKKEALPSLGTLVSIRDDEKAPHSVRSNSAKSILEWAMGKPTQKVETDLTVRSADPVAEAARLEQENASFRSRLGSLGASSEAVRDGTNVPPSL